MKYPYQDSSLSCSGRVSDLLRRMSVEEKIGQLAQPLAWDAWERRDGRAVLSESFKPVIGGAGVGVLYAVLRACPWTDRTLATGLKPHEAPAVVNMLQRHAIESTRWGIPLLFCEECVHGFMALGTTVFPPGLFLASTWNEALVGEAARVAGTEARAEGVTIGLGPILDLARDPRWSRVEESFGEDPWLASRMGVAMVKAFQGAEPGSGRGFASTLKHFAAHGEPEGGHNSAPAHAGPRELHEVLLAPFRAAVRAGAGAVMASYNEIDGIPCSGSRYYLTELLRREWGFGGIVMSDCGSVEMLVAHGVCADNRDAVGRCFHAGLNSIMTYPKALQRLGIREALEAGSFGMDDLDACVRDVLALKFRLGLFEHPYVDEKRVVEIVGSAGHRAVQERVTREGLILLKNEADFLPLAKTVRRVAVIGPNADRPSNQFGHYICPQPRDAVWSVLDGVRSVAGSAVEVLHARGCGVRDESREGFAEAVTAASGADVAIVVVGGSSARRYGEAHAETGASIIPTDAEVEIECGEGMDRSDLGLPGVQEELLKAVAATGTPVVVVYIAGRPLDMRWAASHARALLVAWYPGAFGGKAVAEVLFGDYNPAGRLPVSIPRSAAQLPVYYNHKPTARKDYVFEPGDPLYGFGFGLSYTTFAYDALEIAPDVISTEGETQVSVRVTNTGLRDGDEVVQLYVTDVLASTTRPVRELRGFQRVHLAAGASTKVTIKLQARDLVILDEKMQWVVEPGKFRIAVGGSQQAAVTAELEVVAS